MALSSPATCSSSPESSFESYEYTRKVWARAAAALAEAEFGLGTRAATQAVVTEVVRATIAPTAAGGAQRRRLRLDPPGGDPSSLWLPSVVTAASSVISS